MPRPSLALATLLAWMAPSAAQAALVNDYSPTDDVWNTPVAAGHLLLDLRTDYTLATTPTALLLPVGSIVYGVVPNVEAGVWGAYGFTNPGLAGMTAAPQIVNPYVKWQFATLGKTALGVVGGYQIPTIAGTDHDVALEGVASTQFTNAFLLDVGLGAGDDLGGSGGILGHVNVCGYYTIPSGQTLLAEAYGVVSTAVPASYGQHVGVDFPVTSSLTTDVGISGAEVAGTGFAGLTPQLGATYTF